MPNRRLKYNGRRKALFGTQESAILAAAGINAATQLIAAGINSMATKQAAKDQAQATIQSAQRQAQAVKDQTARSKEYQEDSQEFIKEQNAENRELQKDIQLQLQLLTSQQNVNDRFEAGKIKVRNGGSIKRRLRGAGKPAYLLQGGDNMPFVVTDGGDVEPIRKEITGIDVYDLKGKDHNHYHPGPNGKPVTGVGLKFFDPYSNEVTVVEGEGNQNKPHGEVVAVDKNDAYFETNHPFSKRQLAKAGLANNPIVLAYSNADGSFTPANAVRKGLSVYLSHPIQEITKQANGISDDGKHGSSPVKKIAGGMLPNPYTMYNQTGPQICVDAVGDTAVGVAYASTVGRKRKLRNGGFTFGNKYWDWYSGNWVNANDEKGYSGPVSYEAQPTVPAGTVGSVPNGSSTTTQPKQNFWSRAGKWVSNNADLVGAGITGLGNIGGALITSIGNHSGAKTLAGAYNQAAGIMKDAYNSLQTIDMDSIRREDFAAAHALPALQAPVSMAAANIAGVDRQLQRRLSNARKYSPSGAAFLDRSTRAEVDTQDMRNKINSVDQEQMQNIRQANAQRVSESAVENAKLDALANQEYTGAYLNLLKYDNDIKNQKILGAAGALSEGAVNAATALSQARTANASAWAQSLIGTSQGFANTLSSMATRKADLEKVKLGATGDTLASYYANSGLATEVEALDAYNALKRQYKAANDDETKRILKRRANTIASARGFELIV